MSVMVRDTTLIREQKNYSTNIIPQIAALVNTPRGGKSK